MLRKNFVATYNFIVATKVEKNYRKNVATHKFMSRHNEELKPEIFVATIGSYVVTLREAPRRELQNVATFSKTVTTQLEQKS